MAPRARLILAALTLLLPVIPTWAAAAKTEPLLEPARAALRLRDYPTALERVRQSADAGKAEAQVLRGLMELNGGGLPMDRTQAEQWLRRSLEQNNATAAYVLAALASQRSDAPPGEAASLLQRAAALGYKAAIDDVRLGRTPMSAEWAGLADNSLRIDLAIYSARNGDLACLKAMGSGVRDLRDPFGAGILAHAVAAGAAGTVKFLIEQGSNVNLADSFGVTPLMLAAQLENPQLLQTLLSSGARADALDSAKRTALFYAARADRAPAVSALVQAGAKLDATDLRDYTALDAALTVGANAAAAQLRTLGAKSLVAHTSTELRAIKFDAARPGDIYHGWPVVALAVARNDTDGAQKLLQGGADADSRTLQGDTLLHVAYHAGAGDAFRLLLAAHANPHLMDKRGRTVLVLAATSGDLPIVTHLISSGVSADAHGDHEDTPLLAAARAGRIEVALKLLVAGAKVDATDARGESALLVAASIDNAALVKMLLASGASVHLADSHGETPLWRAARAGAADVAPLLLAAGADVDAADKEGRTPLMSASAAGQDKLVTLLLDARARIDLKTLHGDTPLILAAAQGNPGGAGAAAQARWGRCPESGWRHGADGGQPGWQSCRQQAADSGRRQHLVAQHEARDRGGRGARSRLCGAGQDHRRQELARRARFPYSSGTSCPGNSSARKPNFRRSLMRVG
jgi:ankyrin repeat protein